MTNQNPYKTPTGEVRNVDQMIGADRFTGAQMAFNIVCLIWGIFSCMGIMSVNMVAQRSDAPEIFHTVMGVMVIQSIVLLTTSIINLVKKHMITATSVVQIVFIFFGFWTIPVSIWGIILLIKKISENVLLSLSNKSPHGSSNRYT